MAKQQKIQTEKTIDSENLLNWFQACNTLQIAGMHRRIVEKKFEDKSLTEKQWRDLLKKEKLA